MVNPINNIVNAINLLTKAISCVRIVPSTTYLYAYLSATAATTITAAGTFYKALGTTTEIISENFTHASNKFTYTGTDPILLRLSVGMSVTSDTNNVIIKYCAAINGVAIPHSQLAHKTGTAGDVVAMSGQKMIEMSNGDYFELFVTCDNAGAQITVEYMTVTIH